MIPIGGFFPFSAPEASGADGAPAAPTGGSSSFFDLLAATMARIEGPPASASFGPGGGCEAATDLAGGSPSPARDALMRDAFRFVLDHEGSSYVARDGGESSRYGILQSTAARYGYEGNVKNMSRPEAEAIYGRIWKESGAQALKPGLAIVHFDTYVNSPAAAKKMLVACGGREETYLRLRSERYARLAELRPGRYARYMKGWMNRVNDLRMAAAPSPLAKASS